MARDWAIAIESRVASIAASGVAPPPAGMTVGHLIDLYAVVVPAKGRTKATVHNSLKRDLGDVLLSKLNAATLKDYVDKRIKRWSRGVTISIDLYTLTTLYKWARLGELIDVDPQSVREARQRLETKDLALSV
ncbi:MAG: hypothetical protein V7709_03915 [Halioglobus sp.]